MKLTHVRLLVTDFKRSFNFYKNTLGFTCLWGNENSDYADFKLEGTNLAIFKRELQAKAMGTESKPSKTDSQDVVALIFQVKSVDTTYQNLQKKNVLFVTKPKDYPDWGIRAAHFRDPEGYLIETNEDLKK